MPMLDAMLNHRTRLIDYEKMVDAQVATLFAVPRVIRSGPPCYWFRAVCW
jgi:hypothetical protein